MVWIASLWCGVLGSGSFQWPQGMSMFTVMKHQQCNTTTYIPYKQTHTMSVSLQSNGSCDVVELNTGSMKPLTACPLTPIVNYAGNGATVPMCMLVHWVLQNTPRVVPLQHGGGWAALKYRAFQSRHTNTWTDTWIHQYITIHTLTIHTGMYMWTSNVPVHTSHTNTICSPNDARR